MTHVPHTLTRIGHHTLPSDTVAELLNVKPTSLRQMLSRGAFPPPDDTRGRINTWHTATVFTFIKNHRPELAERIPRLYPRNTPPEPARFLGARAVAGERGQEFIAYLWQPSDDQGPVALAYNLHWGGRPTPREVEQLRTTLNVAAIAIPDGQREPIQHGSTETQLQPSIGEGYRDTCTFDYDADVRPTWFDLAFLLQRDLPWWPYPYRNREAMLSWEPGSAQVAVVPGSADADRDPYALLRLSTTVDSGAPQVKPVITDFFNWHADRVARSEEEHPADEETHYATTPGITVAARGVSPVPAGASVHPPSVDDTALVLHSLADPLSYSEAQHVLHNSRLWEPFITETREVARDTNNPLAQQWLSRLRPASNESSGSEIGYLHVQRYARERRRYTHPLSSDLPVRLVDPLNPGCWIASFADMVVVTVAASMPMATGTLVTLDLTDADGPGEYSPWWTDSAGVAWPLPGGAYNAGYDGQGPGNLVAAVGVLAFDAGAAVGGGSRGTVLLNGFDELSAALRSRGYPNRVDVGALR